MIQKLLKHSKSWINLFSAIAGTEIKVGSALGAETLAIFPTKEFRFHVQNKKRGKSIAEIKLVSVENKGFGIIGISVGDKGFDVRYLDAVELFTTSVANASHVGGHGTLECQDTGLVEHSAHGMGVVLKLLDGGGQKVVGTEGAIKGKLPAGNLNYLSQIKQHSAPLHSRLNIIAKAVGLVNRNLHFLCGKSTPPQLFLAVIRRGGVDNGKAEASYLSRSLLVEL